MLRLERVCSAARKMLALGLALGFATPATAIPFTFSTIDVPGADRTEAYGINNSGQVVGLFFDSTGLHGFLMDGAGFTTFDLPPGGNTAAFGINESGHVVGSDGVDGFWPSAMT